MCVIIIIVLRRRFGQLCIAVFPSKLRATSDGGSGVVSLVLSVKSIPAGGINNIRPGQAYRSLVRALPNFYCDRV